MSEGREGFICIIILFIVKDCITTESKENADFQEEIRAVLINCEHDEEDGDPGMTRFHREELYKHDALSDCQKKLALTLKLISVPTDEPEEDFIPIEHVFEGPNKKRARILDPYVLRLRREKLLQAYAIQPMEVVTGVLLDKPNGIKSEAEFTTNVMKGDELIHLEDSANLSDWSSVEVPVDSINVPDDRFKRQTRAESQSNVVKNESGDNAKKATCASNILNWQRSKRNEHNIIIQDTIDEDKMPIWRTKDELDSYGVNDNEQKEINKRHYYKTAENNEISNMNHRTHNRPYKSSDIDREQGKLYEDRVKPGDRESFNSKVNGDRAYDSEFVMYELGQPTLWTDVRVQLFKKMTDPEGKTVWNDLTRGDVASVGSSQAKWEGSDLTVRYKTLDWADKEFTFPRTGSLCLLVPKEYHDGSNTDKAKRNYLVVPMEDIQGAEDVINKRRSNYTDYEDDDDQYNKEKRKKRVVVRTARAHWVNNKDDKLGIVHRGPQQYLTLPYQDVHHAVIDLEAKADDNQLVRVGSSGRISTIVSDSTRRTRSIITVQFGNTGLAAARFRAIAKDCGPGYSSALSAAEEGVWAAGPLLVPPRHTRQLVLDLPTEMPADVTHCSVSLVNDKDESVALRDVTVKRGDRCFCVWHCDCVCLGDDPKLICRAMPEPRQAAAGMSRAALTRRARANSCGGDQGNSCFSLNCFNILLFVMGLVFASTSLGLLKASIGLAYRPVGVWGLERIIMLPRRIDRYYEPWFADRKVIHSRDGWPLDPDTKKPTVRCINPMMEFVLNMVFFLVLPWQMLIEYYRRHFRKRRPFEKRKSKKSRSAKLYNTQDHKDNWLQGTSGRASPPSRPDLSRWMTPPADQLTTDLWKRELTPYHNDCVTRPLLSELDNQKLDMSESTCAGADSDRDDAEYVVMQLQKSRESLAKCQQRSCQIEKVQGSP